ncbi:glycine cleavage system protein GcvH [Marinospirillum alkaliphilum]|uniref:Glycine cleavage system H protein n=1 Tax=Marinospirillum alkaliphilum DSM 21637 TaxID=1122209 RepID=A0A1K1W8A2_9GAMM|nr:glycine cleavage system protein GcvH [Marinospirillum alkaliphilum]SFX33069.1 glycine cleavage system H protein [Marinospirillum alkaliphilum DSM 21637]
MSQELRFCATHQWAQREGANRVRVGISEHAAEALGDIVYVELPEPGKQFHAGDVISGIESVKTASEIQSPVSGHLVECNQALDAAPELLNDAPLETWVFVLECDPAELDEEWQDLMDAPTYATLLETL